VHLDPVILVLSTLLPSRGPLASTALSTKVACLASRVETARVPTLLLAFSITWVIVPSAREVLLRIVAEVLLALVVGVGVVLFLPHHLTRAGGQILIVGLLVILASETSSLLLPLLVSFFGLLRVHPLASKCLILTRFPIVRVLLGEGALLPSVVPLEVFLELRPLLVLPEQLLEVLGHEGFIISPSIPISSTTLGIRRRVKVIVD